MSKTHRLKTLPWSFIPVMQGRKTFEVRRDDRGGFNVGDILILAEWDTMQYTGRFGEFEVTYVTDYQQQEGYVVMGIRPLPLRDAPPAPRHHHRGSVDIAMAGTDTGHTDKHVWRHTMTDTTNLKERIAMLCRDAVPAAMYEVAYQIFGTDESDAFSRILGRNANVTADRIIALFREALLAPEALDAMKDAYEERRARNRVKCEGPEFARTRDEALSRREEYCGITAALGAITTGGDGHE